MAQLPSKKQTAYVECEKFRRASQLFMMPSIRGCVLSILREAEKCYKGTSKDQQLASFFVKDLAEQISRRDSSQPIVRPHATNLYSAATKLGSPFVMYPFDGSFSFDDSEENLDAVSLTWLQSATAGRPKLFSDAYNLDSWWKSTKQDSTAQHQPQLVGEIHFLFDWIISWVIRHDHGLYRAMLRP